MSEHIKKISEDQFAGAVAKGLVLVDFYADWCGPCRMLTPHLETVAKEMEGQVTVIKLDVDHAQETASKYQVTSVPTLLLLENGKAIGKLVGVRDAKALKEFILSSQKHPG